MPIDVMYPLSSKSSWEDNELRYSLRSMEKFFPEMGRVFVVGHRPPWLTNVVHLPAVDSYRHNKDANLITKVLLACANGISDTFLRCSDDQCLLRLATVDDLVPRHCGHVKCGRGGWWARFVSTCRVLQSRNLPFLYYECHIPMLYDRDDFVCTVTQFPFGEGNGFTINSLYFNASTMPRKVQRLDHERTGAPRSK